MSVTNLTICFAIICHNFEKRLAWQLSSIAQQEHSPILAIHIATMAPNHVQTVVDWTLPDSKHHAFVHEYTANESDDFAYRSMVRNIQVEFAIQRKYKWIYFADCDMVYHPHFFRKLGHYLLGEGKNVDRCIYCLNKYSTELEATNEFISTNMRKTGFVDCYNEDAFNRVMKIKRRVEIKPKKNVAWGGMQVCSVKAIQKKNHGRYSMRPDSCGDKHLFRSGQMARGDRGFRSIMGQQRCNFPLQIHLEHARDKEAGYHLEEQR